MLTRGKTLVNVIFRTFGLVLLFFCALPLHAGTRLIFPRIVFQQGIFSGIAIANATAGSATISLKAYTADGQPFAGTGVTNPRNETLSPGQQYVKLAKQIFNPPSAIGEANTPTRLWVEVTSQTDGLTGFFLDGDDALNFMDGSDVGAAGIELILPIVENNAPSTTEIALVNPSDEAAGVYVDFLRANGTSVFSSQKNVIPARGALFGPLSTLFPNSYAEVATLKVSANRPVACYGYIFRASDNSLITVPAQSSALAAKTLYFPQLAEGAGWATTAGIVNTSATDETISITAYRADGTLFTAPDIKNNPVTRLVPKHGLMRESARSLFGFPASPLQEGWIKVEAVKPALYGYVEYGAGTNRALVSAQLEPQTKAIFSYQALQPPFFTGLAILNPSSLTTNVEVVSLGPDGKPLGKSQRALRPGERQSQLVEQWVKSAAGAAGGAVFVKSDNPVIATQLFGTTSLSLLANVPPQKITTSFDPAAQLPTVKITPPLAVVETGKPQKFTFSGAGGLSWYIDDKPGGSADLGTVAADGTYRAPSKTPGKHNITIQARNDAGDQSGGASINVVQREQIAGGLATVTAVAYFENVKRFFIAEQQVLAGAPETDETYAASTNARILRQYEDGKRETFLEFAGESLGKMLPYVDSKNQNWLLVAGTTSGRIIRINLETKQQTVIAEGLNKPNSMALDSGGDLLVAAEDGVQVISRSKFDATQGGPLPLRARTLAAAPFRRAIDLASTRGVAVDSCSGAVYVTTADGTLWEYIGKNKRDVLLGDKMTDPNEIFPLYLDGETKCQEALILLICESKGIAIVVPSESSGIEFVSDEDFPRDLEFFPGKSPFSPNGEPALVIAETNQVTAVGVDGLYSEDDPLSNEGSDFTDSEFPHLDPEGDTFETLSPSLGYKVPDIVAVDAIDLPDSVLIGIAFSGTVSPPSANAPDSVDAIIDLDIDANYFTGVPSVINEWSLLGETFLGVDAYIHFLKDAIIDITTKKEYPIDIIYLDDVVVVEVPKSLVDLSSTLLAIIAGNLAEITDIAPNELYLDIGLLPPSYAPDAGLASAPGKMRAQAQRPTRPPRRPRAR